VHKVLKHERPPRPHRVCYELRRSRTLITGVLTVAAPREGRDLTRPTGSSFSPPVSCEAAAAFFDVSRLW